MVSQHLMTCEDPPPDLCIYSGINWPCLVLAALVQAGWALEAQSSAGASTTLTAFTPLPPLSRDSTQTSQRHTAFLFLQETLGCEGAQQQ